MSSSAYDLLKSHPRSSMRWIGVEVERIAIKNERPLRYEPDLHQLLKALHQKKGWKKAYESEGFLLALEKEFHSISVEPGGQFEISPAPRKTVGDLKALFEKLEDEWKSLPESGGIDFLYLGLNPFEDADSIPLLPSPRYRLMDSYFRSLSLAEKRGPHMMRLSAGLQVNLDFASDEEGLSMLKAGFLIAPYLSALFSNSPFYKNKRSAPYLSERHAIWRSVDPLRSQFIDEIFEKDFNLEKYCRLISQKPLMYAYDEVGNVFDPRSRSLNELPASLQKKNALAALRQMFTEVRIKPCCVELRFLDAQTPDLRDAATALTVGLIYDEKSREWIFKNLKSEGLVELMDEGAKKGLHSEAIYEKLPALFERAREGLLARGFQEESFLAPAVMLLEKRITPAEIFIRDSAQKWGLKA